MQVMPSTATALRATFNEQGYVLVRNLIPEPVRNRVLEDLKLAAMQILQGRGLLTEELGRGELLDLLRAVFNTDLDLYLSILRLGSKLQSVYALVLHDRLHQLLEELSCRASMLPCGVAIHLVADDLKVPGGYFGWGAHQDWSSSQGSLDQLVLWTPLMDVDKDFYPVEIVPGSHKLGVLPGDRQNANNRGALITIEPGIIKEQDFVPVQMSRGDVLMFSGLLVHRTGTGTRKGLRIACGTRYDNLEEPSFVQRGYPCAFRLQAETQVMHPGFPTPEQVQQLFE